MERFKNCLFIILFNKISKYNIYDMHQPNGIKYNHETIIQKRITRKKMSFINVYWSLRLSCLEVENDFYRQKTEVFSEASLRKRCSENMQQIHRRTPLSNCDFNKDALQLYWHHTSPWVFSCKFAAYFQSTFV